MDLPNNFLIDDLPLGIDRCLTKFDLEVSVTYCPHLFFFLFAYLDRLFLARLLVIVLVK